MRRRRENQVLMLSYHTGAANIVQSQMLEVPHPREEKLPGAFHVLQALADGPSQ